MGGDFFDPAAFRLVAVADAQAAAVVFVVAVGNRPHQPAGTAAAAALFFQPLGVGVAQKLLEGQLAAVGAVGDFAFGQHVEILAFLLVGYCAAGAGAVVFGIVFRFVQAAAGQHQHAGENIVLAGQGGGDAVAAVSAAVAVFKPQIQRFVAADKIGGAVGAHGNGAA